MVQAACHSVEVPVPAGMDDEWSTVLTLAEPGSLFAFSADLGPDHFRHVEGRPRFIDFEASKYQPAFCDAAIGWFVFPSSYLVNRLPPEIAPRMEAAYRAELVKACPEAGDDHWFNTTLVNAGGLFILKSLIFNQPLAEDLKEDRQWGHASMRQRRLLHLDAFATMSRGVPPPGGARRAGARAGVTAAHPLGVRAGAACLPRLPLWRGTKLGDYLALGSPRRRAPSRAFHCAPHSGRRRRAGGSSGYRWRSGPRARLHYWGCKMTARRRWSRGSALPGKATR